MILGAVLVRELAKRGYKDRLKTVPFPAMCRYFFSNDILSCKLLCALSPEISKRVVNISRIFLIPFINPILIHFLEVVIIGSPTQSKQYLPCKIFITLLVIRFFQFFISIVGPKVSELYSSYLFQEPVVINGALVIY